MSDPRNHRQQILEAFQLFGYKMTLGQMLQHPWGYEVRARISELRKEGHVITYHRGKTPSEGVYVMLAPPDAMGQYDLGIGA